MSHLESGHVTGTKDKNYDLIWFVEASLNNALRMASFIEDAEREGDTQGSEDETKRHERDLLVCL